ncbi:hypothetical protein TGAM01_v209162 [Trichoderma gamsii]|uniref:Uncharacterized protein n=1 Tax=Trichoderma gamsii TaxID=398673 RepID=A0A2P4ZC90_9HYPO|nr:hypothetical protein TGAM01_v209162 [Trichoderma gamsii]PON21906.1 hypothetical protein TGAM01_v209162 [Trichoderma gamsii]
MTGGNMVTQPLNQDANEFKFVPVKGPCSKQDRSANRSAKSHAVKHALKAKRLLEQESKRNFRITLLKEEPETLNEESHPMEPPAFIPALSASAIDPFGTLPVDSSRLQMLLDDSKKLSTMRDMSWVFDFQRHR